MQNGYKTSERQVKRCAKTLCDLVELVALFGDEIRKIMKKLAEVSVDSNLSLTVEVSLQVLSWNPANEKFDKVNFPWINVLLGLSAIRASDFDITLDATSLEDEGKSWADNTIFADSGTSEADVVLFRNIHIIMFL
ncbi:hypothetical protein BDB01DRAFT_835855 [Pilobolus umbonatus]|nr:hypothetical protein BDB01DRAFT_835855 [Pilobolus umbonatus]